MIMRNLEIPVESGSEKMIEKEEDWVSKQKWYDSDASTAATSARRADDEDPDEEIEEDLQEEHE